MSLDPPQPQNCDRTAVRMRRYLAVTAVATPLHIVGYAVALRFVDLPAWGSNLLVASLLAWPTFLAYRHWVWSIDGPASMSREFVPYWTFTTVNVGLASTIVALLEAESASQSLLVATPTAVYTVVWIMRFLFLDRVIFRSRRTDDWIEAARRERIAPQDSPHGSEAAQEQPA